MLPGRGVLGTGVCRLSSDRAHFTYRAAPSRAPSSRVAPCPFMAVARDASAVAAHQQAEAVVPCLVGPVSAVGRLRDRRGMAWPHEAGAGWGASLAGSTRQSEALLNVTRFATER